MKHAFPFALVALFALAACTAEAPKPAPAESGAPAAPAAAGAALAIEKTTPSKDYPLDTCPVSGEKLGSMGDRIAFKVGGVEVQLCCPMCEEQLRKTPEAIVAQVQAGMKK